MSKSNEFITGVGRMLQARDRHDRSRGRFHFDSIFRVFFLDQSCRMNLVITKKILIHYQGEDYKAWMYTKHNYEENGELNGKPIA